MKKSGERGIGRSGDREETLNGAVLRREQAANAYHDLVIEEAACNCHPERTRVEQGEASASRRTPTVQRTAHAASGNSHDALRGIGRRLGRAWNTLRATLSEIFDESAYDRFLFRTHQLRSVASYRDFSRERDVAMAKKPRCC